MAIQITSSRPIDILSNFIRKVLCIGRYVVTALVVVVSASLSGSAHGEVTDGGFTRGTFGVGLNYPGVGLRYFFVDRYAAEIRGQFEKDILVAGLRVYRYFGQISQVIPLCRRGSGLRQFQG